MLLLNRNDWISLKLFKWIKTKKKNLDQKINSDGLTPLAILIDSVILDSNDKMFCYPDGKPYLDEIWQPVMFDSDPDSVELWSEGIMQILHFPCETEPSLDHCAVSDVVTATPRAE